VCLLLASWLLAHKEVACSLFLWKRRRKRKKSAQTLANVWQKRSCWTAKWILLPRVPLGRLPFGDRLEFGLLCFARPSNDNSDSEAHFGLSVTNGTLSRCWRARPLPPNVCQCLGSSLTSDRRALEALAANAAKYEAPLCVATFVCPRPRC